MDDVILLSSGSDEDSDIEFVSSYRDDSSNGIPFFTAELLPVTPVLIDITGHHFSSDGTKPSRRLTKKPQCSTIEVIDLNDVSESLVSSTARSSCSVDLEKDVISLDSGDVIDGQSPVPVSCDQEDTYTNQWNSVQSLLQDRSMQSSGNTSPHSGLKNILLESETSNGLPDFFEAQDTNQTSTSPPAEKTPVHNESLDSPHSWLNKALSPFTFTSPYYCPSEIDAAVFSDESLIIYNEDTDQKYPTCRLDKPESPFDVDEPQEKMHTNTLSPSSEPVTQTLSTSDHAALLLSPTSTELLAGDSPETGSDLLIESPPVSPFKFSYTLSPPTQLVSGIKDSTSVLRASGMDADGADIPEPHAEDRQQISLHTGDEDNKEFGMAEPLCRQSLSLVYSTIEENYTEGTLQLLSDLIQPCYYPPADITAHLLRGILLKPQCTRVLALEAFNLLMRTQKYHPADRSTIPCDWELLSSVMAEQDETRKLCGEVRLLLLQYVLQVLEDDFYFKLPTLRLHLSIANEMLSCDYRHAQVSELLTWLLDAAKQSFCTIEDKEMQKRERNCCLKMLLILQRMLLLAMEVDLRPTCSSSKLSRELCTSLNSMAPCRRLRFLLLSTLQSNLLRCKMVELLLDQSCSQKRVLPMSFKLLLHFLHTSTLAPDPSDGTERWRRWDELLQLVWMLMLSYQEVITGHLRYSIAERFKLTRAPMWTQNDHLTRDAVQEAAEAFLSRAVKDLGHDLPSQIQDGSGMPKEKYEPPDPRRMYTLMTSEEAASGKKSHWAELEISGKVRSLSSALWSLTHLTVLHLSDNSLSRIPPDISKLHNLVYLDLSSNKIRSLPAELGNMVSLRELLLNNNQLRVLPFELGKLFQLQTLGLKGNPLAQDLMSLYQEPDGTRRLLNYLLDNLAGAIKRIPTEHPPSRSWIVLQEPERARPAAVFSVMCYNVLCDKYATRQLYGYCPAWALNWEHRKKSIMQEILGCNADIISLQEVETEQYYHYFLVELKAQGYEGFFSPKSRARTMSESDRKHVDGCAIFYKTEKFSVVQKHTVEFNQLAMANSEGSEAMLNRVMTKDNIGVAVLLELRREMMEMTSGKSLLSMEKQLLLVANAHMHWDPEYSDVKLVQTMMFLSEVKNIVDKATRSLKLSSISGETNAIPLVLCADLNSLPDSGVVEFLSTGGVDCTHKDFKELRYSDSLTNFNCNGKNSSSNGRITHGFKLKSAYENGLMPYTNYTFDFKGVIDYIFCSEPQLNILGVLGPLDHDWLLENNVSGCPHPHIPSDHFSLFAQLELLLPQHPTINGVHLPARR
ncbi:CCR4-NOT transcription complex subunit 6 [Clarias magur]|uniref:poly(A)-specific ribonuclease n=1 Tax=Clarias magur TaxID=1594786 RepID=A0A8J4U1Z0_CLAMG|nr:CCR4-NOT transcription complex subunit 6 [Clarias magur]